ncbi:MAG: hypothetical protein ACYCTV_01650 [Leptospirales bacterium]
MKAPGRKNPLIVGMLTLSLLVMVFLGTARGASTDEDFSDKVDEAVKSTQKAVDHAFRKTREYIKSEAFHRDLKRVTDGASNAVRNAGDWLGNKIDSASKQNTQKH